LSFRDSTSFSSKPGFWTSVVFSFCCFAAQGAEIFAGDEKVGEVTSGTFSPCLKRPIAMGYVSTPLSKVDTELTIMVICCIEPREESRSQG